ncbi:MAG: cupin domain-containing protein [Granulosicoccus sp.]
MFISSGNAEHYHWGDNCDGWHLVKTPMLSVIKERVPSGCGEIRHYHQSSEQFFFVLSGIASLEVDGQMNLLEAQQGLHIPAGIEHQLRNDQQSDLIFLVTSVPPSHGDRITTEDVI